MHDIFKVIIFSLLINWCVSLQVINQSLKSKLERVSAIILSLIFAGAAGFIILL